MPPRESNLVLLARAFDRAVDARQWEDAVLFAQMLVREATARFRLSVWFQKRES
jgi:hypothetical protein